MCHKRPLILASLASGLVFFAVLAAGAASGVWSPATRTSVANVSADPPPRMLADVPLPVCEDIGFVGPEKTHTYPSEPPVLPRDGQRGNVKCGALPTITDTPKPAPSGVASADEFKAGSWTPAELERFAVIDTTPHLNVADPANPNYGKVKLPTGARKRFPVPGEANFGAYISEISPEGTNPKTQDDRLVDIGKEVPGFGGMFLNPGDRNILNVYLLDTEDTEQRAAVEAAIKRVFPDAIPPGGIQVVQGQYSVVQLKEWYDDMRVAVANSGLVGNGLVLTDLEEDKNRLEIAVESSELQAKAAEAVDKAGIPREVVRITIREPFRLLLLQK